MSAGKNSLMYRFANSPTKDMQMKAKATINTNMTSTTMDATVVGMNATVSSPFRDTIKQGMITGAGFFNNSLSMGQIKKPGNN
jgi:hypothetical protein